MPVSIFTPLFPFNRKANTSAGSCWCCKQPKSLLFHLHSSRSFSLDHHLRICWYSFYMSISSKKQTQICREETNDLSSPLQKMWNKTDPLPDNWTQNLLGLDLLKCSECVPMADQRKWQVIALRNDLHVKGKADPWISATNEPHLFCTVGRTLWSVQTDGFCWNYGNQMQSGNGNCQNFSW